MFDWSFQRRWEDVAGGDVLPSLSFPLNIPRLVVQAGANKDFASIHHNAEWAQRTGAADMYVNNVFIQGMWERAVREYIGLSGIIKQIGPLRMKGFNTVGDTVIVTGRVEHKWIEDGEHFVQLAMSSSNSHGESVVGSVTITLPTHNEEEH